ncbi:MAG TPA: fibronectin type III domain-containing protein, partial [Candidatus Paceibacterota bacterium]
GANGLISPVGTTTVNSTTDQTFTFTPNAGYLVSSLTVDGVALATSTTYTFANVVANHTINVTFAPLPDMVPPVITLNGSNPMTVNLGDTYTEPGAVAVDDVDGTTTVSISGTVSTAAIGSYIVTYIATDKSHNTATSTRTVNVVYPSTYTIIATAGLNGAITPTGTTTATSTTNVTFTITPDSGYRVDTLNVDGVALATSTTYTFTNIIANHTIDATFAALPVPDTVPPVITLIGANPMTIPVNTAYVEPGATAMDAVDGTTTVDILGTVGTTTPGIYKLFYVAVDKSGNTATSTRTVNVTDNTPLTISNVSVPLAATTSAIVEWQTSKPSSSQIFWGTAPSNYSNQTTLDVTDTVYHVETLSGLTASTTYYYVAVSTDDYGNVATSTEQSFNSNQTGNNDVTPPVISGITVPADHLKSSSARITFATDEIALANVSYGISHDASCNYPYSASTSAYTMTQSIDLSNLSSGQTYYFCAQATDPAGNTSAWQDGGAFTTAAGPHITGVAVTSLNDTGATITWNTATSSDSYVYYSLTTSGTQLQDPQTIGTSAFATSSQPGVYTHSITLQGLTANTVYSFYVKSTDADGDSSVDTNGVTGYYQFTTTLDTTPPVISEVQTPVTSHNAAVISWRTDELSTSQVEYGTTASTTDGNYSVVTTLNSTPSIFHVITLSSETSNIAGGTNELTKDTTYYYRVKSVDLAGNVAVSNEYTFNTNEDGAVIVQSSGGGGGSSVVIDKTPPVISSVSVSTTTPFTATITFTTSKPTRGTVLFGTTQTYDNNTSDLDWTTTHTVMLKPLHMATLYHFAVNAVDESGNVGSAPDQTFKTLALSENLTGAKLLENNPDEVQKQIEDLIASALPALNPPFIQTPAVSDITENGATITWKTNVDSFGSVSYAPNDGYASSTYSAVADEPGALKVSDHKVVLTDLKPNTFYHYSVHSYVFPQVTAQSADATFTTKSSPVKPEVLDLKPDSFRVLWNTDSKTTSILEFTDRKTGTAHSVTNTTLEKEHDLTAQDLQPGHVYDVVAYGYDINGSRVGMDTPMTVTTTVDRTLPQITALRIDSNLVPGRTDIIQSIVSWRTDKPSTSAVYFEEGAGTADQALKNKIENETGFVQDHVVILPDLKPSTIYRIQVSSTDQAGNTTLLPIRTIVTPQQSESIVDIIFKNFSSTFNFIH